MLVCLFPVFPGRQDHGPNILEAGLVADHDGTGLYWSHNPPSVVERGTREKGKKKKFTGLQVCGSWVCRTRLPPPPPRGGGEERGRDEEEEVTQNLSGPLRHLLGI
jgi:hypothetical protein